MNEVVVALFQWLLVWMLNCMHRQLMTSVSVKRESFHNGGMLLPMRNISCERESMRSYVLSAYRQDWLCWNEQTALLSASLACRCPHSWVCVISGEVENLEALSNHSLLSSQTLLTQSRDSPGHGLTTSGIWISLDLFEVSKYFCHALIKVYFQIEKFA